MDSQNTNAELKQSVVRTSEPQAASACQNNGGIPIQVRFVQDDRGGHIEFGDLVWRPERDR